MRSPVFELASAFAPTLHSFLVCRALFGVAMGGVWGVGAALALETLPPEGRGFFSGLLQEGYVIGNLLAAALFGLLFSAPARHGHVHELAGDVYGWGAARAAGVLSAVSRWRSRRRGWPRRAGRRAEKCRPGSDAGRVLAGYLPRFCFLVVLMTAFTSF